MKLRLLLASLILLVFIPLNAQTTRKYSNEFMNIGVDAAALGQSNAVVARSNDVNAGYWNPAGLGFLDGQELALMHVNWLPGLADDLYYEFWQ